MDLDIERDISSTQETEYSVSCVERENPPYLIDLHYLVNCNVLQTFARGLHVPRQILATFALPISH